MFYDFICDIRAALVNYSEILFLVVPRSTAETEFVERSVDIIVPAEQVSAANRVDNAVLSTVHRDVHFLADIGGDLHFRFHETAVYDINWVIFVSLREVRTDEFKGFFIIFLCRTGIAYFALVRHFIYPVRFLMSEHQRIVVVEVEHDMIVARLVKQRQTENTVLINAADEHEIIRSVPANFGYRARCDAIPYFRETALGYLVEKFESNVVTIAEALRDVAQRFTKIS